jgi:hypothetical protein
LNAELEIQILEVYFSYEHANVIKISKIMAQMNLVDDFAKNIFINLFQCFATIIIRYNTPSNSKDTDVQCIRR